MADGTTGKRVTRPGCSGTAIASAAGSLMRAVVLSAGLLAVGSAMLAPGSTRTVLAADEAPVMVPLDNIGKPRYAQLREVERYQFDIAEKYYRDKNWKVAMTEYEKYLTLYETSDAASHTQLKWSLCLRNLRKANTAISEGFQSVIDYWPESPDAAAAAYYIAETLADMGETRKAKKAYRDVIAKNPNHLGGIRAAIDLIEMSKKEGDVETCVKLWKHLTFEAPRVYRVSDSYCVDASRQLCVHYLTAAALTEAVEALETTYPEEKLPNHLLQLRDLSSAVAARLAKDEKTKPKAERLADLTIAYIRERIPTDISTEEGKTAAQTYWFYMIDMHSAALRDEKVPEVYQEMQKKFGADDVLLGRFANWYKSRNKYDEARGTYRQFKNKVEGWNQIAYSHRQQGDYLKAVDGYQQALNLDPENPVRWKEQIALNYRYAKKWDEAVAVYYELRKDDAERPELWLWNIAHTYREAHKYKEAIDILLACESYSPSNYEYAAECHRAMKQYPQAVLYYRQVIGESESRAPHAQYQIAKTYEQAGKKEAAIQALQAVCKKYPKTGEASRAHAWLQSEYKITVTLGGAKDE